MTAEDLFFHFQQPVIVTLSIKGLLWSTS